jgi:Fe-S-cluster-containing hydrogenase component 2
LECDDQTGVFFQPDKCNQCNLCRDICPRNCVEISVTIDPNDILDGKPRLLVRNSVQEIAEFEDPPEKKLARLLGCQVTC